MRILSLVLLSLCLGQLALGKNQKQSKDFQFGVTLKNYEYSEPSIDVSHKGLLYGIWGEWLWGSAMGNGRTLADLVFGTLNYHGGYYDEFSNFTPVEADTLDVITKIATRLEYPVAPGIAGFAGFGGRYLYDMGNNPDNLTIFYRRTGLWFFVPVGLNLNLDSSVGKIFFDLQYDFIVYGKFESRLGDSLAGAPTISHTQTGYGLTLTSGLQNDDYSAAVFYETWNLNKSNGVQYGISTFTEPQNSSTAIGLKLGYKF